MKRFSISLFLSLFIFFLAPVQANDFLEKPSHYQVKTEQTDVIKLKLPVYSVGFYSYFIKDNALLGSYVYFRYNDGTQEVNKKLFNFNGEMNNDGPSHNDKVAYGFAYVNCPNDDIGVVEIANLSDETRVIVPHDGNKHQYTVTKNREMENGNDYVTWLEINWFPPAYLKEKTFSVGVDIYLSTKNHSDDAYNYHMQGDDWVLRKNLKYSTNLIDAQLFEPYFHAVNEKGAANQGYAAIPYSLFYEPISYKTSLDATEFTTSQRTDNLYVPTTDTIQPNFTATFKVWYDKEHGIEETQTTQAVAIPPYHRIHDFLAYEERDSTGTFTGNTVLQWNIKNPQLADIMEGDFFEIQRAMKKDFSDAESMDLISMQRGAKYDTYAYTDESRSTWTGSNLASKDTVDRRITTRQDRYELTTADGKPLAVLSLGLRADQLFSPGVPVYYRIRRASSSVWGWDEQFSHSCALTKHNFLAPLAEKQASYKQDKEFSENHKVHFSIALDNKAIQYDLPKINECTFNYDITEDSRDSVQLHFNVQAVHASGLKAQMYAEIYDRDGDVEIPEWAITASQTVKVPHEGRLSIKYRCSSCYDWQVRDYIIEGESELLIVEREIGFVQPFYSIFTLDFKSATSGLEKEVASRLAELEPELKKTLLAKMQDELNSEIGRCMWDRTARLVLVRSSEEHPDAKSEIVIPQDSIHRQADGSWLATYTDIANQACTHYTYAVRIDQSKSDLHVQDSAQLLPARLTGDDLYYNEAARIASFTASQGATDTNLKRGVMLSWAPTTSAVDEYILLRKPAGSTDAPDTLYTGLDVTYFDVTATPDVHYDYTIVTSYECNGKLSKNSADAQGWRTPYGEISGAVMMPDNSGIAGVEVKLYKDDVEVAKLTTTSTGAFRFDSLLYDIEKGTNYVVLPTASNAIFSRNGAGSATISLTANNAVAEEIYFENTNTVRLTGRALYHLSSIPVAGAMFLLNGDTLKRNDIPLTTGTDGNFELTLTKSQTYTLQIFKPGHTFLNEGYLYVKEGEKQFALSKNLDGTRLYDQTKVRLVGRLAGGIDQRDLPTAFGLGTNNLGDDLTLVLQLEGDNTARFVLDPDNDQRDTLQNTFAQLVYHTDPLTTDKTDTVGHTSMLTERKRIIVYPDSETGEYAVDLYPVKYKVVQATAKGYATLFSAGTANETFDLTNAPLQSFDPKRGTDSVHYNAVYDRIYRSPVQVRVIQRIYGMKRSGLGEPTMEVEGVTSDQSRKVPLYTEADDGTINYTLEYPLFVNNRKYQFELFAFEDYYLNNTKSGKLDRVPQRGGKVTIHNGLHNVTNHTDYPLDQQGKNSDVWLTVDYLDLTNSGLGALRTVTAALNVEGNMVETDVFRAFVTGDAEKATSIHSTDAGIAVLDIVRDPGGAGSTSYVESGTTYKYAFNQSQYTNFGVNLTPTWTSKISQDIGIITAFANYIGSTYEAKRQLAFTVPLTYEEKRGSKYEYSFTTTERITTSSSKAKKGVGSGADVFVGLTQSVVSGKVKSVALINDSLYQIRKPALDAGTMKLLSQGTDAEGWKYYLVTGEKVLLGTTINNTFVYSQHYILGTVIPNLILERQNLLGHYDTEADAQARANALEQPVYRYTPESEKLSMTDTLANGEYKMFVPDNGETYTDEVAALDRMIKQWMLVIIANEKEKAMARQNGHLIGTWSVNYNNGFTHSDQFTTTGQYSTMPSKGFAVTNGDNIVKMMENVFTTMLDRKTGFLQGFDDEKIGKSIEDAIKHYKNDADNDLPENELGTRSNVSEFKIYWAPVYKLNLDKTQSYEKTNKKTQGFSLVSDSQGDITVSVYRVAVDSLWYKQNSDANAQAGFGGEEEKEYGSYVFITRAGSSYCPHEDEEKTLFYNPGTLLHDGTSWIAKPSMSINTFEQIGVPADGKATFRLELKNDGEALTGEAASGTTFDLFLIGASNPNGAKVSVNGVNLMAPVSYFLTPGQSITQTIEVERGQVDDYDDLQLFFSVSDCPKTNTSLKFGVHFLPESSPVALVAPRQGWVMNTLSPHDSIGYYLPIDISGFNIRHKNFDHIEFQYKLASQSDDDWTNLCSFYADDSLYALASGNKAMIENGVITPFRFYGERDPMEQQYDLRAVTYCRYGSGFVTKSSPVISGVKDTRPPRVFGAPEPANAILGVGDNLRLRFNEAIAGNYLDEDNNFQLLGMTNATGITAGTSLHFDGSMDSYAATKVSRTLSGRSISIDMLVKPANPNDGAVFFRHGEDLNSFVTFGKTTDNRLYIATPTMLAYSKTIDPILDFTRVTVTYNAEANALHFYCGTKDVTDEASIYPQENFGATYRTNAPLVFGPSFNGNMLEVRVWTKALTHEEIAATHMKRLTGYERELAAYYPMNEGKGTTITDKSNGATLYTHGATWTNRESISLHLNKGQRVQLNSNVLARSKVYDFTLMFWFKAEQDGTLFSSEKFQIATNDQIVNRQIVNSEWHHYVLSVDRAHNTAATFIDGKLINILPSDSISALTGDMYLGGDGFEGNFDDLALFEQALPKSFIEQYDNIAVNGDEMGLIALLSFNQLKRNSGGSMQLFFSINDQRIFRDSKGNIVEKIIPLVVGDWSESMADKANFAPISDHGQLTKLNFDWAFNNDELLININMADREINKQSLFVTVRDVEDLHGNPMVSPATWTAFVDKNALKWEYHQITMNVNDNTDANAIYDIQIINNSGKRHQYSIESLPSWLSVNRPSGAMDPMEEKTLRFTFSKDVPVGIYSDIIYLSDEDGLLDPLRIEYTVEAVCPYDEPDKGQYTQNMSICGQVMIGDNYATDPNDKIIALYHNDCVGMANITFDELTNQSNVYLTVYGDSIMANKVISFQLWQASTGKTYMLTPSKKITFAHGYVYGCTDGNPILFTTSTEEQQAIDLTSGWNWISFNLKVPQNGLLLDGRDAWTEGDLIKNPANLQFSTYYAAKDTFLGNLIALDYRQMYMFYCANGNNLRISGDKLTEEEMQLTLRGNGQWNVFPYLLSQTASVTEALADYYDDATQGDLIKSHDHFAVFSGDKKWVGDLTALRPGEGYLFRRMGAGRVEVHFYEQNTNAPRKVQSDNVQGTKEAFSNPKASSNMTMICKLSYSESGLTAERSYSDNGLTGVAGQALRAYIGDELVGVAQPLTLQGESEEAYYFLTIQSDAVGTLRFETEDGVILTPSPSGEGRGEAIIYSPNAHHGTLKAPIILIPGDNRPYKIIENNHVIIIRNNEKYDITGKKL